MELSEFKEGKIYRLKKKDWEAPTGEVVPGKTLVCKILDPVTEHNSSFDDGPASDEAVSEWKNYLRVKNLDLEKVHLLHPAEVVSAEQLN